MVDAVACVVDAAAVVELARVVVASVVELKHLAAEAPIVDCVEAAVAFEAMAVLQALVVLGEVEVVEGSAFALVLHSVVVEEEEGEVAVV